MSKADAERVLAAIYDIVNTADWQTNGKYPEQFGPFCGSIVNLIDQHWNDHCEDCGGRFILGSHNCFGRSERSFVGMGANDE